MTSTYTQRERRSHHIAKVARARSSGPIDVFELRRERHPIERAGIAHRPLTPPAGELAMEPPGIAPPGTVRDRVALALRRRETLREVEAIVEPSDQARLERREQETDHQKLVDLRLELELDLRDRPV